MGLPEVWGRNGTNRESAKLPPERFEWLLDRQIPRTVRAGCSRWQGSSLAEPPHVRLHKGKVCIEVEAYRGATLYARYWPDGSWQFDPEGTLCKNFNMHPWSRWRFLVHQLTPCYVWSAWRHRNFDALYLCNELFRVDEIKAAGGLHYNARRNCFNVEPWLNLETISYAGIAGHHYNPQSTVRLKQVLTTEAPEEFAGDPHFIDAVMLNPNWPLANKLAQLEKWPLYRQLEYLSIVVRRLRAELAPTDPATLGPMIEHILRLHPRSAQLTTDLLKLTVGKPDLVEFNVLHKAVWRTRRTGSVRNILRSSYMAQHPHGDLLKAVAGLLE